MVTNPTLDLLDQVVALIRRYVVVSDPEARAVALWVLHTHAFTAAEVSPTLSINSAEKRSGKTLLLEVLSQLVARPWMTARVTAAVLVRKVATQPPPTLLLDESDAAFNGPPQYAEALRGILNAGYRRGGVTSLLVPKGGDGQPRDFPVFAPKAIAGIGKLPDTVADRSIPIVLRRRKAEETTERFRQREVAMASTPLSDSLSLWAPQFIESLSNARPSSSDFVLYARIWNASSACSNIDTQASLYVTSQCERSPSWLRPRYLST